MSRRLSVLLACGVALVATLAPASVADAHHYTGTCGEVGIWTGSGSYRSGIYAYGMGAYAYVGYSPPAQWCYASDGSLVHGAASQHSAVQGRQGPYCLETLAQRWHSGYFNVFGYDCGASGSYNVHNIPSYGHEWMYLWQSSGNTSVNWAHWYYRMDTAQWIYLGQTAMPYAELRSFLESSGYNESSTRTTLFRLFQEYRTSGNGTTNFPCPESIDADAHQEARPNVAGYPGHTDFVPDGTNSC